MPGAVKAAGKERVCLVAFVVADGRPYLIAQRDVAEKPKRAAEQILVASNGAQLSLCRDQVRLLLGTLAAAKPAGGIFSLLKLKIDGLGRVVCDDLELLHAELAAACTRIAAVLAHSQVVAACNALLCVTCSRDLVVALQGEHAHHSALKRSGVVLCVHLHVNLHRGGVEHDGNLAVAVRAADGKAAAFHAVASAVCRIGIGSRAQVVLARTGLDWVDHIAGRIFELNFGCLELGALGIDDLELRIMLCRRHGNAHCLISSVIHRELARLVLKARPRCGVVVLAAASQLVTPVLHSGDHIALAVFHTHRSAAYDIAINRAAVQIKAHVADLACGMHEDLRAQVLVTHRQVADGSLVAFHDDLVLVGAAGQARDITAVASLLDGCRKTVACALECDHRVVKLIARGVHNAHRQPKAALNGDVLGLMLHVGVDGARLGKVAVASHGVLVGSLVKKVRTVRARLDNRTLGPGSSRDASAAIFFPGYIVGCLDLERRAL